MKVVPYQHVSIKNWCRSVPRSELLNSHGNCVYFHDTLAPQPPIDTMGLRAKGGPYDDLANCDEAFQQFAKNFDLTTKTITALSDPFIAKLEDVRIEFPGFGIFVGRHLLLEESYHDDDYTNMVIDWYGKHSVRRNARLPLNFDAPEGPQTMDLDVKYYLDRGSDQHAPDTAILLSGPSAYNYHHWLMEMLPKFWCMEVMPEIKDLPIIVRGPLMPFQLETLLALGIAPERIRLFTGSVLSVKTLIFPSHVVPGNYSVQAISWIRRNLPKAFGVTPGKPKNLIYVSRSKAASRRLVNEPQLIPQLEARGFKVIHTEDMTVKQQVELFADAKMVLMPHGAAGGNVYLAQPGCVFIEMLPSTYRHVAHLVYSSLAECQYGCIICDDSANPQLRDMVVDIDKLLRVVDHALNNFGKAI